MDTKTTKAALDKALATLAAIDKEIAGLTQKVADFEAKPSIDAKEYVSAENSRRAAKALEGDREAAAQVVAKAQAEHDAALAEVAAQQLEALKRQAREKDASVRRLIAACESQIQEALGDLAALAAACAARGFQFNSSLGDPNGLTWLTLGLGTGSFLERVSARKKQQDHSEYERSRYRQQLADSIRHRNEDIERRTQRREETEEVDTGPWLRCARSFSRARPAASIPISRGGPSSCLPRGASSAPSTPTASA